MRRGLTLLAVAGWLALHAWLWTLLPPLPRWAVPGFAPHSIAFTPDNRSLVTADRATVSVFDVATGRREHAWPRAGQRPRREEAKGLLVMSPTDRRVIVYDTSVGANSRERPYLVDVDAGEFTPLPAWDFLITADDPCIGFLPDGRAAWQLDAVMKPTIDNVLRVWDLPDGAPRTIVVRSRLYAPPSFSADGRLMALAPHTPNSPAGSVQILDVAAGRVVRDLVLDGRQAVKAVLSPDGRTVAVASARGFDGPPPIPEVDLWGVESSKQLRAFGLGSPVGWTPAGRWVAYDGQSVSVRAADGTEVARWPAPEGVSRYDMSITPDGRSLLAWQSRSRSNFVYKLREWSPVRLFGLGPDLLAHVVFDTQTGRQRANIGVDELSLAELSADGSALATTSDGTLRVWDIPPRTPGGVVLGVMIVQVALLTAWTAWRKLRKRAARREPAGV